MSTSGASSPGAAASLRVYISYSRSRWEQDAAGLAAAFAARGATVVAHMEPSSDEPGNELRTRIGLSNLMIVLVAAGDEVTDWMQEEVRQILLACWRQPEARAIVVAPAVGAIPSGLRHRPFVTYMAHDEAQIGRWNDPKVAQGFVDRVLGGDLSLERADAGLQTDEEIRQWRNRLVHVGQAVPADAEEAAAIRQRLVDDLAALASIVDRASTEHVGFTVSDARAVLDRGLLAHAIQDQALTQRYYEVASRVRELSPPDRPDEGANLDYALGLLALEVDDPDSAAILFERSAKTTEAYLGDEHPITIAAMYNLGLSLSKQGRTDDAQHAYSQALDTAYRSLGPTHPQTAAIAYNWALLKIETGDREGARELLMQAAEAYSQVRPEESPERVATLRQLEALADSA